MRKMVLKYVIHLFLLLSISLVLVSCDNDDTSEPAASIVTESDMLGIWRRTDVGKENNAKEYLPGGTGYLGSFSTGSYVRASQFTWTLNSSQTTTTSIEYRLHNLTTYNEDIIEYTTTTMTLHRQEDGIDRHLILSN